MAQMNLWNRNRGIENKLTLPGGEGGMDTLEIGIDTYTLLYLK